MPATSSSPSSASPAEAVIASCSFCGKPNTEVQKLIAGPGIYICNQCVDLCGTILADEASATPAETAQRQSQYRDPSTEDILTLLPALVRNADRTESELARRVSDLRERDTGWTAIATAAGMSVDAARQRFEAAPPQ